MEKAVSWRALKLDEDVPQLLVKTRFDKAGYEVQLTDLSRLWAESLGKNEIVERTGDTGCSIDPSEDDQYQILLDKIGSALRGDKGTTLNLHSRNNGESLQLDVSAPLPGSLPTFKWSITLMRMPESAVGSELVTPLLGQATQLRNQMQQLIGELASKDRVIAKITDRLETSGNDLTAVFPGVSNIKTSRKKSQRAQLASHVKGLADFDEDAWRAALKQNSETPDLSSDLLNTVLEDLPVSDSLEGGKHATDTWWTELPSAGSSRQKSHPSQSFAKHTSQPRNGSANGQPYLATEDSMQDDEFQRQGTPPQLKKQQPRSANEDGETTADDAKPQADVPMEDAETKDEDDLDPAPSGASSSQTKGRSQQQDGYASSANADPTASRKLGILGGRKSKSPQPAPEPEAEPETEDEEMPAPKPKSRGKLGAFGGKKSKTPEPVKEPEPEPEVEVQDAQPAPPKPKSKLGAFGGKSKVPPPSSEREDAEVQEQKPKSRLGAFGGKGKSSSKASTESEPVEPEARMENTPSAPVKGKLGRMGGKSASKDEGVAKEEPEDERQPRAPEKADEAEEQQREDSQERADKKRERLKREMEEKAKGPAKKKRKF